MCPYLEAADDDNYCGLAGKRVFERRANLVCGTDSFYDCSSYNNEEYDEDSGFSGGAGYDEEPVEEEIQDEPECEYAEECE